MKLPLNNVLQRFALAAAVLLVALPTSAQEVMWGSSSSGTNPGSLYTINPTTGAAVLVGSTLLLDDMGRPHKISAIAVDPQTGTMYGIAGSACSGAELVTIDPSTGAGTVVGPVMGMGFDGSDSSGDRTLCWGGSDALTFTADGTLYAGGWNGGTTVGGKLLTIDKNTGGVLTNKITDPAGPLQGAHIAGLAVAADGTLWVSRGNNTAGFLHTIDPSTGGFISTLTLSDPSAVLSDIVFASDGTLYASIPNTGQLVTVDTVTGLVSPIGPFGGNAKISGLTSVIVEVPAVNCTPAAGGCNLTGGQTLTLPPNLVIPAGATVTQKSLRLTDPRVVAGTCGMVGLTVDIPDTPNDLFIPPFLCGTPDFVVLATEAPDLEFLDGLVSVENEPGIFFADPLDCNAPIPVGTDPQQQDVVVWQPTVAADVFEVRALELTDDCGSSRGSTRGFSYFVVGMAINFGLDHVTEAEDLRQAFIGLTAMKFEVLGHALKNAKTSLVSPRYGALRSQWSSANDNFQIGNYAKALQRLDRFIARVEDATFDTSGGFNDRGNLLMRARNIRFMIEVKVIPFAP